MSPPPLRGHDARAISYNTPSRSMDSRLILNAPFMEFFLDLIERIVNSNENKWIKFCFYQRKKTSNKLIKTNSIKSREKLD